jgi:hypothetical protein
MADETTTLRFDGPARRFRFPAYDVDVRQGETFSVAADATIDISDDDDESETVSVDEYLTDHLDVDIERTTDWYAVLDESVPDLRDALAAGDYDHRLDALAHAEREGENRTTALEAIAARRQETDTDT